MMGFWSARQYAGRIGDSQNWPTVGRQSSAFPRWGERESSFGAWLGLPLSLRFVTVVKAPLEIGPFRQDRNRDHEDENADYPPNKGVF